MEYTKLVLHPHGYHRCTFSSNEDILMISYLLIEVGCPGTSLDNWIFDDDQGLETSGNRMELEKKGDYIYIGDMYDQRKIKRRLKISRRNLFDLFYNWQTKICKKNPQPQEVIIKYENDIFTLETID